MSLRALAVAATAVAALATAACKKSEPPAQAPSPTPAAQKAQAEAPPIDRDALPPGEKARPGEAEVEFMGEVAAKGITAKQLLIYVSKAPCNLQAESVEHFGTTAIPFGEAQNFFIEVFVPQGAQGFVCAAALDEKRQVVAEGSFPGNPLRMEGAGEVIFDKLKFEVRPLTAPVPLPKGL